MIGVGTWAWGNRLLWGYRPERDDPALRATFQKAVESGLYLFDTAGSYGTGRFHGRSESLLGEFAETCTEEEASSLLVAAKLAPYPWRLGRQGLRWAFDASRERLKGHLHRVQLHWSTARYAPWQEGPLVDGLADLVLAGDVDQLGLSNMGPKHLFRVQRHLAERGVRLSSLQVQASLLCPDPLLEGGVGVLCRELDVELMAYSPLALGLLSIPPGEAGAAQGGLRGALYRRLLPRIQSLLGLMADIAAGRGASQAQVAINWCRFHGALPLVGMRREAHVNDARQALGWTLNSDEAARLTELSLGLQARMPANPFQSD